MGDLDQPSPGVGGVGESMPHVPVMVDGGTFVDVTFTDTNGDYDIYVRDLQTGRTKRVSESRLRV